MIEDAPTRDVSSHADDAARRGEERYRSLIEATSAIVWNTPPEGTFESEQPGWSAFTGQTFEELRGTGWLEAVHPDDRANTVASWEAARSDSSRYSVQHRLRRRDGEYRYMMARAVPLRDDNGRIREWIGVHTDVTAEYRLQQMVEAERLSLRDIFMRAPAFIATLSGPDHVFETANPHYMKLIGEGRDVIGKPVREALPELEGQGLFELVDRVYSTGEPFIGNELRVMIDRSGTLEERYLDFVYQPMRDADGQITGIFAHGNDVTEQVRARRIVERQAEELERANLALLDQMLLNKNITDNAASCLFMMDAEGRPTFMNPAAEQETGFTLEEIRHLSLHEAIHHHHDDGRPFPADECPLEMGGAQLTPLKDYRAVFIRKDGSKFPASCYLAPFSGRLSGSVLEFRDISAELLAQETLREADRRKDEFIATLSHELRTPLTAILGWSKILMMPGNDDATTAAAIETINRSALVQAQLIDDVLDISRITTGKVQIASDTVDVVAVARGAMDTVRLAADAKGVSIDGFFETKEPFVLGDATRLQQVVWNLLSNAIKFTPEGGSVHLAVRRAPSGAVTIEVTDTGIGIRSDFLPHVFEAFRQAESATTRVHGGLGLGLSIVRYLVELHGGRIAAESAGEGAGTKFTVELPPLRKRAATPRRSEATALEPVDESVETLLPGSLRVLVIDDQDDVRDYIATVLRRSGAVVRVAASVQEGIVAVKAEQPQLILCDIAMPHEDGFAFVHWMKEQEAQARVPVVAITAFGRDNDADRVRAAGFEGYIRKPVEPVPLVNAVAETVERWNSVPDASDVIPT